MKRLFRGVVILLFLTVICVIAYFLLSALKKMYLSSWLFFDRSVVIGFLSGLGLTFFISLINYYHALRDHAKERASLLDAFAAESESFLRTMDRLQTGDGTFTIPEQLHPELERALARLDDCAGKIARCERISPLKSTTIEKRGSLTSKIARAELAFDRAFAPFAEHCSIAFHAHGALPYLKDEAERQIAQADFFRQLKLVFDALTERSAMRLALQAYRERIDLFLGVRRVKKQDF
ncbi:MAG: hypothetical protein PHW41_00335 [Eubacteriales bacterium]|nr:hypothetical protein [Eubacteriales bacterium]